MTKGGLGLNVGELSTLAAALSGAVSVLLLVVAFIVRRVSQERRDLREMQNVNVIQARYIYNIEMVAARKGWDTPEQGWPAKPKELTPEYLAGKVENDGNPELIKLLQTITGQGEKK